MRDDRDSATREAERRMVGLGHAMAASITGLIIALLAVGFVAGAGTSTGCAGAALMLAVPAGVRVWLASGPIDMRRGMNSLALQVQQVLKLNPNGGDLFVFRGKRGHLLKVLWADGLGMSLYIKRLEHGRFIWPAPVGGVVSISGAQLAYLLDGIDWRLPKHTWQPQAAG
jgi:transposase